MKALFLSDIHLKGSGDPRFSAVVQVLQDQKLVSNLTHLFLVGDIFDFWLADHEYFRSEYFELLRILQGLKDNGGVEVIYFEGNHDLDLKPFFESQLGIRVCEGPEYFQLGRLQVRVEHGDQMDPEDTGYLFLRWLLRTPVVRYLGRVLPGRLVTAIGNWASRSSRYYTTHVKSMNQSRAIRKIRTHAHKAYADKPFDLLVSGHMHVRDDHTLSLNGDQARSVNLGSWLGEGYILLLEQDRVTLIDAPSWPTSK